VLDSPIYLRTPETWVAHWVERGPSGAGLVHHYAEITQAAAAASLLAQWPGSPLDLLRWFATEHELDWSSMTWLTLIWPHSARGRALGVESVEPALLLVERACGSDGRTGVSLESTVRTRCTSHRVLEAFGKRSTELATSAKGSVASRRTGAYLS
jgi:hypothetical protein